MSLIEFIYESYRRRLCRMNGSDVKGIEIWIHLFINIIGLH